MASLRPSDAGQAAAISQDGSRVRSHFDPADPEFELIWKTLLKFFPSLNGSRYTHAWGGALGVSRTMNPAVCFNKENHFAWAGGYFGDGVGASNLAGRTLADLILERDTDRLHTPWVNPDNERELDQKLWEIEPIRWLGINSRARLMQLADQAEYKNSSAAPLINKTLVPCSRKSIKNGHEIIYDKQAKLKRTG